jgi:anti-sigma factor RsiW
MRGKLSDKDLTDYALNELEPHERLYVESMLAVSEECRADVYDMIEMGQMIEEGFERDTIKVEDWSLTSSQRAQLLTVRRDSLAMVRKAATVLAAAACVAFALTHPALWPNRGTAVHVAQVSREVASVMTSAVAPGQTAGMAASFDSLRALVEEPGKWIPEAATAVCTPPQWLDIDADPMIGSMGMPDLGGAY